jgi:hypothetical protein
MLKKLIDRFGLGLTDRAIRRAMRRLPQYHILRQQLIDEAAMNRVQANLQTYTGGRGNG